MEPHFEWWWGWCLHLCLTLAASLLHLNVKSGDTEVTILIAFMLSKHIQSSWVAWNSFMIQPLPTSSVLTPFTLSSDSVLQPYWTTQFLNVTGVYRPLYHCMCCFLCHKSSLCFHLLDHVLYILSDLLKSWILRWVCAELPMMS